MCIYKSHEKGYLCMPMAYVQPQKPFYTGKKRQLPKINSSSHSLQANTCGERSFMEPMCQWFYLLSGQLRK